MSIRDGYSRNVHLRSVTLRLNCKLKGDYAQPTPSFRVAHEPSKKAIACELHTNRGLNFVNQLSRPITARKEVCIALGWETPLYYSMVLGPY